MLWPILLFAACGAPAWSQTNGAPVEFADTNQAAGPVFGDVQASNAPPAAVQFSDESGTHIYSDTVQLGIKTRTAVYRGHVRLDDPRIHLTCEQLTASVPEKGKRVDRVVAETNVVIVLTDDQGKTNRAYADKAVYTYSVSDSGTNEVVELTGHPSPRVEREEGILYGDVIVWDRIHNQIRATNQRMIYRAEPGTLTNTVPRDPAPSPAAKEPPPATETTPHE